MERLRVRGGSPLDGSVRVTGAKNSVLKLMAATLLAEGRSVVHEVPQILDVEIMAELLRRLDCAVDLDVDSGSLTVDVPDRPGHQADYDLVRRLRASISVLGPLLARCGEVDVALPGGDAIGSRGLDLHVAGLVRLGAEVTSEHGYLRARAPRGLRGATIWLDFPSVGATENLLMAAVCAQGSTVLDNAAREPEIVDLCHMLVAMGAEISGIGTPTLEVVGVDALRPVEYTAVPDRIVAGTWAFAAATAGGRVRVERGRAEHLDVALDKIVTAGASVTKDAGGFTVEMSQRPRAVDVVTLPYPGFPTDLQPMVIAMSAVATGTALVTENVFEARFMFANEIARLGADIRVDGHHAVIRGQQTLSGAPVRATDIRAGAGLVVAGLVAEGVTTVSDAYHIDRGYPGFDSQLRGLGADVVREPDEGPGAPTG